MKFVFEVGVGLFEARTILEELHQPLFVRTHSAPVRTSFEKTELIDQGPASSLKGEFSGHRSTARATEAARSEAPARHNIPAIYLTSCCGSSADPVHA